MADTEGAVDLGHEYLQDDHVLADDEGEDDGDQNQSGLDLSGQGLDLSGGGDIEEVGEEGGVEDAVSTE